jgi:adenylosuccinate lyase
MNKLINNGMSREAAYDIVQKHAMDAYNNDKSFKQLLLNDKTISKKINKKDIESCFTLEYYFKNINYIYKKVGLN